ncbi:UGSC family (seleno)protein [Thermodesulfobacteriota bacterium]
MHCTKLERMGVPTAPVHGDIFASLVKMHAGLIGMPHHRMVFVPHPISREPASKCREYIEADDPITGRPVLEEVVEALTMPLNEEDKGTGLVDRPVPRLVEPDSEENLQCLFLENKWTDYLPIVLPTEERVAEMCKGTSHKPDEVVGEMRAGYEACSFTVEKVAANAVMAGARPEYLPVILAMAASGVPAIPTSTQSFARMIVINGPIRTEIGMNSGCGAMSPFNQANSVIGRTATLISTNLGAGGIPNLTYWGSQGNTLNYNHVTFAENEEELPMGWKPFHVQKGFKPEESVVNFFHQYGIWHWKNTNEREKHKAILHMADWVLPSGAYKSGYTLLLDPIVADHLMKEGFLTKESLSEYTYKNSLLTVEEYWKYHLVEGITLPSAQKGVEPYASWLKEPKETKINRYLSPDEISIFIVGGKTNDFWQAGDGRYIGSFSIDDWR